MAQQIGTPGGTPERPAVFFSGPDEFRAWLEANHDTETELWMGLYKKHVADRPLTWEQAVPVALCYGWIDSVAQRIDDDATRQRWSPRKPSSIWSKVNIALVEELTAQGLMTEAGLAAYARRREDRTGVYSHENPDQELPPEWAARVEANPAASAFLEAATPTYRRQVTHWVLQAKQQATRERRLAQLIDDSAAGELVPFQRYGETPKWVLRAAEAARAAGGSS
ncbi:YdeI/OmpD-associated family protein [Agromyces sp. H3Y2-19a]|uniref:YdeI/OmpD-associated family protein n=1 Tax=Agromyces TaxID=33877 RepID=UPI001E606433|nr:MULTISPECIES: YdeI/OmpD-associated family protein [Agromyces]MCD5348201.1 YdeI/OmpD-associated family protein [Agromyces sp. S2-1-8]MDF0514194.1 YdeI/OmpD-associated family protein [Agromyces chromiiresistens]